MHNIFIRSILAAMLISQPIHSAVAQESQPKASEVSSKCEKAWTPTLNISILEAKTAIFFDLGKDDPNEIDVFKDGKLGVSLNFLSANLYLHHRRDFSVGFNLGGGISSSSGGEKDEVAVLALDGGFFVGHKDFMLNIGLVRAISAKEGLDSGQRDDTGMYVGLRISNPKIFILGKGSEVSN